MIILVIIMVFAHDPDCMKKYKEISDKINEGLELFGKWFMHLWW